MDWTHSTHGKMGGFSSCAHGNERSLSIKDGEFLTS